MPLGHFWSFLSECRFPNGDLRALLDVLGAVGLSVRGFLRQRRPWLRFRTSGNFPAALG